MFLMSVPEKSQLPFRSAPPPGRPARFVLLVSPKLVTSVKSGVQSTVQAFLPFSCVSTIVPAAVVPSAIVPAADASMKIFALRPDVRLPDISYLSCFGGGRLPQNVENDFALH